MAATRGLFVAVDGPKHVGKTTVLDQLVPLLEASFLRVLRTKEPSEAFDLSNEQSRCGADLARLLADDRAGHLQRTIEPGLAKHDVVITDRYIASSLVFQVLDGVPFDQVWEMNDQFLLPDLNFLLSASEETIDCRRHARGVLTRLDQEQSTGRELDQYADVSVFLADLGVRTVDVRNDANDPVETAAVMAARILDLLRPRP